MAGINRTADVVSRRLPTLLSPEGHRAADYLAIGSFAIAGALLWKRNRDAALASFVCGSSMLGLTLLTSYPGRTRKYVSFDLHTKLERGIAAVVGAVPELLRLEEQDRERHFFSAKAGILTLVCNLTSRDHAQAKNT